MKPSIVPSQQVNFCDDQDAQVQQLVQDLRAQCGNSENADRSFAMAAFAFVRDEIQYKVLHNWSVPVSYTLSTKTGNCGTKACLLVALLRAGGLQAEFCVERIDTQRSFFFVPTFVTGLCNNSKSLHFSAAVKFQDQDSTADADWIRLDPSVDWSLATGISGVVGDYFQVVFDGKSHAVPGRHNGEHTRMPSLDYYMNKKSRVPREVRDCFNKSADFCRQAGQSYTCKEALLQQVEAYLMIHFAAVVQKVKLHQLTLEQERLAKSAVVASSSRLPATLSLLSPPRPDRL